jgi:hypothetical protein
MANEMENVIVVHLEKSVGDVFSIEGEGCNEYFDYIVTTKLQICKTNSKPVTFPELWCHGGRTLEVYTNACLARKGLPWVRLIK